MSVFKLAFERSNDALTYGALLFLSVVVFIADILLPLGIAIWVFYLLPMALAYFGWRPQIPLALAAGCTAFVLMGFFWSPNTGFDPQTAAINRTFGVVTIWILAATGYAFIRNKVQVRAQQWLQAGQVGLSRAMAGEQPLNQLGDSILRFLAEYVGAQAGALFVQDGGLFRRQAAYAVPGDAPLPETFSPGQGLLGQAAKDGRSFRLANVPEGQLHYGSGLSRGTPRELVVAPIKADGDVNAVVELGFVSAAVPAHEELLERIADSVGIAVRSAKYRARLQELLQETQRQAEELQSQSDELRATNSELEQQSRALQESQARLEQQQAELEQTNAQLEEQTQLLEAQRDDLSRAQANLQSQARELEQASRYKSEFVANMSHELRTPLNSLLIMARLLADNRSGTLTAEQVKYATTIESSGNDLLMLINDILDISKIEAGRVELQLDRVSIAGLAEKLVAPLRPVAAEKGLSLRSEVAADSPAEIESDPQRLEQILKNFLSNAIKFTPHGEVVLSAGRHVDGRIALTVRDTGIGIPPDQQTTIFEPFRQADGTISRKYGGTGLGLSISRELARLLGGEITVDSAEGRGSAFTLLVPQAYDAARIEPRAVLRSAPLDPVTRPAPRAAVPPPRPRAFPDDRERLAAARRTLLVVEDDIPFARILYDLAHELDFACLVADTAEEGVTLARQFVPDAVILDMNLPDHTGMSVLDRLKRDVRTRHVPVHVVSVADYAETALSLGAMSYMLKPVPRERLVQALEGLERHWNERMRHVLIVEDDETQLESLQLLLKSRDIDTVGVRSAGSALDKLRDTTFDCMVLDLNLPDSSGFALLEQLSRDDTYAFPPVIIYTGRDLSADEELALRRYSKSVIIKGAKSPERLLDEVTLFLHQVVSELPEKQQQMLARSLNRDAILEGKRILVVEDDVRNIFSLTSIFEPHGVSIEIARNGREALDALARAADSGSQPIDLVLMDIMMPEMDGLTAMRHIREKTEWKSLPIIALTAKAMRNDQEECLAAGANDYLAKPLDVDKLLSLVRVWMPR
jgi:signal transduction histidine kinase/DNA-binding response OmpR family regulator